MLILIGLLLVALAGLGRAVNSLSVTGAMKLDTVETVSTTDFTTGFGSVTHNGFDVAFGAFTSATNPPATLCAYPNVAMVAGAATIDLTACPGGLNGTTVNANGVQVRDVLIVAPAANTNPITITPGASNGYPLLGASFSVTLKPGEAVMKHVPGGAGTIGGSSKTIGLAGTGTDSINLAITFG